MSRTFAKLFEGIGKAEFKTYYEFPGEMITVNFFGVVDLSDGITAYLFEEELAELIKKYSKASLSLKCAEKKKK